MKQKILEWTAEAERLFSASELCRDAAVLAAALRKKLEDREITVSVIGQFKRGKSTLVNAMLNEKLLPVGIVPVTSVVTRLKYGDRAAAVTFENGVIKPIELEELPQYISEQKNSGNQLGVASVTLHTPAAFLKDNVTFVDTPGVGSIHKHNSDAAYAFVRESDAVIFMLSVDSPINEIEVDFLKNASSYSRKFYFAVNKMDTVEGDELEIYLDYCHRQLCQLLGVQQVEMFAVSAKKGIGISQLQESIRQDCETQIWKILEDSVRMKLIQIIQQAHGQVKLYWNALQLAPGQFDQRFKLLNACLEQAAEKSEQAALYAVKESEVLAAESSRGDSMKKGIRKIYNGLAIQENELKRFLSDVVSELFGMEYHFSMTELDLGKDCALPDNAPELVAQFSAETAALCEALRETMNRILLYKEQNAYTVARRLDDLNLLTKELTKLQRQLQKD